MMKTPLDKHKRPQNNLVDITLPELIKMGFKQRHFVQEHKGKIIPHCFAGDLLCATNKERALWIILDEKSAKSIDPEKFLVYFI